MSVEPSPSSEAPSRSVTLEFPKILCNPNAYHNSPYPDPDKSSPYHLILILKIHFNSILLPTSRSPY
jgi:hypothetical protein